MQTFEQLKEAIALRIIEYENQTNEIVGCFLYTEIDDVFSENKIPDVYEWNGENFNNIGEIQVLKNDNGEQEK